MQISRLSYNSSKYPGILKEIANPPKELYIKGRLVTQPHIAIVGSRTPTDYGLQVTYKLAYDLARTGAVIVSGLAYGIDAMAHKATLEAGGLTVAVLGGGLDRITPVVNKPLSDKIVASGGALISEYPEDMEPQKFTFPARNRIIAGLSQAVIITEANASSGSLLTANFALEQNRILMAVPGNITSPRSAGPNNLLKSGAVPVTDATDVLAALNFESEEIRTQPVKAKSREEALLLELLSSGINSSQQLIEQSGLEAGQFANIISLMEITGKVRNLGAGQWIARV